LLDFRCRCLSSLKRNGVIADAGQLARTSSAFSKELSLVYILHNIFKLRHGYWKNKFRSVGDVFRIGKLCIDDGANGTPVGYFAARR
jgi:hypothetical protein